MIDLSESIKQEAACLAKKMSSSGEKICPLKFGKRNNSVFVTSDHRLIIPIDSFKLENKTFYIGWGKNKNKCG